MRKDIRRARKKTIRRLERAEKQLMLHAGSQRGKRILHGVQRLPGGRTITEPVARRIRRAQRRRNILSVAAGLLMVGMAAGLVASMRDKDTLP